MIFFGTTCLRGLTSYCNRFKHQTCRLQILPQSGFLNVMPSPTLHARSRSSTGREEHGTSFWDQPCSESAPGRVLGAACGQLAAREHATSRQQDRFHQNVLILGQIWSFFANVPKEPAESPTPSGDAALLSEPKFNLWEAVSRTPGHQG